MRVSIELGNQEVRNMLIYKMKSLMPDADFDISRIQIKVMSSQNYRVKEWEDGEIKVTYDEVI